MMEIVEFNEECCCTMWYDEEDNVISQCKLMPWLDVAFLDCKSKSNKNLAFERAKIATPDFDCIDIAEWERGSCIAPFSAPCSSKNEAIEIMHKFMSRFHVRENRKYRECCLPTPVQPALDYDSYYDMYYNDKLFGTIVYNGSNILLFTPDNVIIRSMPDIVIYNIHDNNGSVTRVGPRVTYTKFDESNKYEDRAYVCASSFVIKRNGKCEIMRMMQEYDSRWKDWSY